MLTIVLVSLAVASLCCLLVVVTVLQLRRLAAMETPHREIYRRISATPVHPRANASDGRMHTAYRGGT